MRLIDADKLIAELNEFDTLSHVLQDCIETVEKQPTAYDVDKVVDQIEAERKEAEEYNQSSALNEIGGTNEGV